VYNYTIALLSKSNLTARDITWVPVGNDATARAAALQGGRADAALLTAPSFFRMQEAGFKNLANLADHKDIYASSVALFARKTVAASPKLPEMIIRAQRKQSNVSMRTKPFAVKAYIAYDKQDAKDVERIYDLYAKNQAFERHSLRPGGCSELRRRTGERRTSHTRRADRLQNGRGQ
jgi:ABC-type nitrate/sulfonate/bicarbonate transport system substrate-binding protein